VRSPPKWISKRNVLAVHERLLAEHGGAAELLDEGRLDAALAAPMNRLAYEESDIPGIAAAYAFALTRNHPFADGNKRVALTVAGVFMELNGVRLVASEQDAANATMALSSRGMTEAQFAGLLRANSSPRRGRRGASTKHPPRAKKK
jgi:death on curing protein